VNAGERTGLDGELERLRLAVGRVGSSLLELEEHPTKALLDAAPLRGATASRWAEASRTLAELFAWSTLLRGVLVQATELRGTRRALDAARAAELAILLHGPSIELSDKAVQLEARQLVGTGRIVERCTPEELTQRMGRAFEEVKLVVLAVDEVWDRGVARVAADRAAAAELESRTARHGGSPAAPLVGLEASLDAIAEELLADPLAIDLARLDDVEAALAQARREIDEVDEIRGDLDARRDTALLLLAELDAAIAAGRDAGEEATAKVAGAEVVEPLPVDCGAAGELDRAVALVAGGDWAVGAAALAHWRQATQELLDRAREIERSNRAPVAARNELRGRLDAFHAKAGGLGRLEDAELEACFDEARAELYTAPTDLARAADLVRGYQAALAAIPSDREVAT
jgi:hypothetical protein